VNDLFLNNRGGIDERLPSHRMSVENSSGLRQMSAPIPSIKCDSAETDFTPT
jgi:hypothetical protein